VRVHCGRRSERGGEFDRAHNILKSECSVLGIDCLVLVCAGTCMISECDAYHSTWPSRLMCRCAGQPGTLRPPPVTHHKM
jgi:hypothetical protein